jgi:hypothetical protein
MMRGKVFILIVTSVAMLVVCAPARAALVDFSVVMNADQVVGADVDSLGVGAGWLRLDTSANAISWSIIYSNLSTEAVSAGFHGPATPQETAPTLVSLDHTVNPMIGSAVISDSQEIELLSNLWYASIETETYPSGEIRGQLTRVVPEPATLALLSLGGLLLAHRRRIPH